jgi:prephenate dehydrogenase
VARVELSAADAAHENGLTVCIVGLGLMGGSLALAWRATGWPAHVIAVNRSRPALEAALAAGAIEAGTTDLAEGVGAADVVVLATPVRTILQLLPEVGRLTRPGTLIMDLGSSKQQICTALAALDEHLQVIGAHPLCGKETAGFGAADAGLYRDRPFVLCPLPRTSPASVMLAERLALAAGARTLIADPLEHDRAVAAISHLPYTLAAALTRSVALRGDALAWSLAASGFRDTSRLAAADVDMMLDILLTNRVAVLDWIDAFVHDLAGLREALVTEDEDGLRARLADAQAGRAAIARSARW